MKQWRKCWTRYLRTTLRLRNCKLFVALKLIACTLVNVIAFGLAETQNNELSCAHHLKGRHKLYYKAANAAPQGKL